MLKTEDLREIIWDRVVDYQDNNTVGAWDRMEGAGWAGHRLGWQDIQHG